MTITANHIHSILSADWGHMSPEVLENEPCVIYEGYGTEVCPVDDCGEPPAPWAGDPDQDEAVLQWLADHVEYFGSACTDPESLRVETVPFLVRMSARGYMDSTDWMVLHTEEEVLDWLREEADANGVWTHPEEDTFTAPAHWASYLINDDHSGLSDEEKAEADACVASIVEERGSCHVSLCSEPEFRNRPGDFGTMAGDYCKYGLTK